MIATTQGLASLEAKLTRIPQAVRDSQKAANDQNALDFMQHVAAIIPVEQGALVASLEKGDGATPLSTYVKIGSAEAPYPAHLEFGHMDHGTHVRAKPFWFTTLRSMRRRFSSRSSRAGSLALKKFIAAGGS